MFHRFNKRYRDMDKGKKVYDFTKVMMEVEFDKFEELDLSKDVGNAVHQNTGDIGIDDIAREIYRSGKAEMTEAEAAEMHNILAYGKTKLVVAAKKAAMDILTKKD